MGQDREMGGIEGGTASEPRSREGSCKFIDIPVLRERTEMKEERATNNNP